MRSKYTVLAFLSVILLVLSGQGRSVAFVPSTTPQQANSVGTLGVRNVVFGVPGVDSSARTLTASDRISARLAAGVVSGAPSVTRAQDANSGTRLPLAADGAKNPERIPDYLAYRHFLSATAVSATASEHELGRRDAALAQVQLSPEDRTAYVTSISHLRDGLTSIERRRRLAEHDDAGALSTLRIEHGRLLDEAAARAIESLSTEGATRLQHHINSRVKSRIKIYGELL